MATIYLHAGMPKTGTTYTQRFLWKNDTLLKEAGYIFPHLDPFPGIGYGRNGYFIRCKIKDENGKRDRAKERETFERFFDKVHDLAKEYNKVILSEETLWNIHNAYWKRFMKGARKRDFHVKIIVYLRRQDLYIPSYWAQRVKEDETDDFKAFLKYKKHEKHRLDYYDRLKELEGWVGKENLIVRVYEKGQYGGQNGNIAFDFLHAIGIENCDQYELPEGMINPSLSGPYLELKRLLNANQVFAVPMSFAQPLIMKIMTNNGDSAGIAADEYYDGFEQKEFLAIYQDQNSKVAREYLGREDGGLFYEEVPVSPAKDHSCTSQELVNLAGQVLILQREQYEDKVKAQKEKYEKIVEKKTEIIRRKQEVIDWETTPFPKKVSRKLKKIFGIKPSS